MNKKSPDIRFSLFSNDWNNVSLNKLFKFARGRGYARKDLREDGSHQILLYGMLYTDYKSRLTSTKSFANLKDNSILSKGNEIVLPSSGETAKDIARATAIYSSDIIIASDTNILTPVVDSISNHFVALLLSFGKVNVELIKGAQGNSVVHLYNSDLKDLNISLPKFEEQTQIGNFFKELDELIELQQASISNLEEMKKGFIQKLFPYCNSLNPYIRFNNLKNNWQKVKLREIGNIQTGNTPSTKDKSLYGDTGMLWVTPTDINSNIISDTEKKLSQKGIEKARIAAKGSILVTCIASIGKNSLVYEDVSFNQQINSLTPNDNQDSYFLLTLSTRWSAFMESIAASSSMAIINKTEFSNLETFVPNFSEQKTIGSFFKSLDELIKLEKKELELLQEMKKGFLQKMFV